MKRDLDLIRKIMLAVEENTTGKIDIYQLADTLDTSPDYLFYQITLLKEADLVIAHGGVYALTPRTRKYETFCIYRLTFKGHDYLESIRNEKVWFEIKNKLVLAGGTTTLDIVKELGISITKRLLGL